jgi:hypothetical protein
MGTSVVEFTLPRTAWRHGEKGRVVMFVEKRKLPRVGVSWKAAIVPKAVPEQPQLQGVCLNLTTAGAAIQTTENLACSDGVLVYLIPPANGAKDDKVFRFGGTIAYSTKTAEGFRIGLRFLENESLVRLKEIFSLGNAGVHGAAAHSATSTSQGAHRPEGAEKIVQTASRASTSGAAPLPVEAPSLLDRIKAEAAQKLADQEATEELKRRLHEDWCNQVNVSLREAYKYFNELVSSLNILKPKYVTGFSIPCVTLLENLVWVDDARVNFKLRKAATDIDRYESVILTFRWSGTPGALKIYVKPDDQKASENSLGTCGIAFHSEKTQDAGGQAAVALAFQNILGCSIALIPDDARFQMRLRLQNAGKAGVVDYELCLEDLNKSALDEVTRLILGEKNKVAGLFASPEPARVVRAS